MVPTPSIDQEPVIEAMKSHIDTLRETVIRLFSMLARERSTPLTSLAEISIAAESQDKINELQGRIATLKRVIDDKHQRIAELEGVLRFAISIMPEANGDHLVLRFDRKTWALVPEGMKGPIAREVVSGLSRQIQKFHESYKEVIGEVSCPKGSR